MYDIIKISTWSKAKITSANIEINIDLIEYEIERAIAFGSIIRNCTPAELLAEGKDYTTVLTEMVVSAVMLSDKLGRTSNTENGIQNQFEDGNVYQKEQTRVFVPLLRSVTK